MYSNTLRRENKSKLQYKKPLGEDRKKGNSNLYSTCCRREKRWKLHSLLKPLEKGKEKELSSVLKPLEKGERDENYSSELKPLKIRRKLDSVNEHLEKREKKETTQSTQPFGEENETTQCTQTFVEEVMGRKLHRVLKPL